MYLELMLVIQQQRQYKDLTQGYPVYTSTLTVILVYIIIPDIHYVIHVEKCLLTFRNVTHTHIEGQILQQAVFYF